MSLVPRIGRPLVLLVILALALPPAAARAGACVDYRDFLHWEESLPLPADGLDVLLDDPGTERAYVVTGTGVGVVSLADPSAPALLDTLDLWQLPSSWVSMARSGDQLWVAAGANGLCLVRTNPLTVTSWIQTPGEPHDVQISGALAVIADWDEGLQIYDAQSASHPRLGGMDLPGFAAAVEVVGDLAYVADLIGLTIIDISVPSAPQRLGSIALSGESRELAVNGEIAYVAGTSGLHTVDVSDPQHPQRIDTLPAYGNRILVDGVHGMLSERSRLSFLDLADPRKPVISRALDHHGGVMGLASRDDRLYLAGASLRVLNHEHFAFPPVIGQVEREDFRGFGGLAIDGELAFAGGFSTLWIVDVSDPSQPAIVSQTDERELRRVVAGDGFAYMVLDRECVVMDVSSPQSPLAVARAPIPEDLTDCTLAGHRLYFLSCAAGLEVVDVTQPTAPVVRSIYDYPGCNFALRAQGSLVYLGGYDLKGRPRLLILDVEDLAAPHAIGAYEFPGEGTVRSLAVEGNRVYLIRTSGSYESRSFLTTIDVSDPTQPAVLGSVDLYTLPIFDTRLETRGNLLYVWGDGGITILDMSDPASPAVLGTRIENSLYSIALGSDWIGATNGDQFLVLPLQCSTPSPVELASFTAEPAAGAIRLTWSTTREWDHLGFHVERAATASGNYERLTRDLLPPPGPYVYLDRRVTPGDTYYYRLEAVDRSGRSERYGPWAATADAAGAPAPVANRLGASRPNPFSIDTRATEIVFSLATPAHARIRLFDAVGRLVATLVDANLPAGEHRALWDGKTARGEEAAAGTYFYRLDAGDFTATEQLVRLR
jgi:hypothetical protein